MTTTTATKTATIMQRDNGKFTIRIQYADGTSELVGGYKTRATATKKATAWGCTVTDDTTPVVDDHGHEHHACAFCGLDCSTHPDAGSPLDRCGDCGRPTCPDHRVDDMASRCVDCASVHYRQDGAE